MSAVASCTWGMGPDVLVVLDGLKWPLVAHGEGEVASFGLDAEEARALARAMLAAADRADECEREYAAACARGT